MIYKATTYQILKPIGKNGENLDWKPIGKLLRKLQYNNACAMNLAMTKHFLHEQDIFTYHQLHGKWPEKTKVNTRKVNTRSDITILYPDMSSYIVDQIEQEAHQKWRDQKKHVVYSKEKTLSTFRKDYPLSIRNRGIKIWQDDANNYIIELGLLSKLHAERWFRFMLYTPRDKSRIAIIDRMISGDYKIGNARVNFNVKRKKWNFIISYGFEPKKVTDLDPDVVANVKLDSESPLKCTLSNSEEKLETHHMNILLWKKLVEYEKRRKSIQASGRKPFNVRAGHGRKKKLQPLERLQNKYDNFRNNINHHLSAAVISFAIDNGAGTIVLENLSGDNGKCYLKKWPMFELKAMITYKADEHGIKVIALENKKENENTVSP